MTRVWDFMRSVDFFEMKPLQFILVFGHQMTILMNCANWNFLLKSSYMCFQKNLERGHCIWALILQIRHTLIAQHKKITLSMKRAIRRVRMQIAELKDV